MKDVRYRHDTLPAALNSPKPRGPIDRSITTRHRRLRFILAGVLAFAAIIQGTRPPTRRLTTATPETGNPLVALLADTRADAARAKLEKDQPGVALAMLVSALKTDPESIEARNLARKILTTTVWNIPETTLEHHCAIDHVEFSPPSTLWVSVSGKANTTVKWNLESLKIENVLFPAELPPTRSLVFDSEHRFVVIERGGFMLLCDAVTLRPNCDIGELPPSLTPSAVITFSPNGLLAAHPVISKGNPSSITWHIRDTGSGEIIRSSEPSDPDSPLPLAAFMGTNSLRVLRDDGSLWTMPISPVAPIEVTPPPKPVRYLHAGFSRTGGSALVLEDHGPHRAPDLGRVVFDDGDMPPTPGLLTESEPWTLQPSVWTGLLRPADAPLKVRDNQVLIAGHAPLTTSSPITAAAFSGDRSFIASKDGKVTIFRSIPPAIVTGNHGPPAPPDSAALDALKDLTEALAGGTCDESGRTFTESTPGNRLQAFASCDFTALSSTYPELDFEPILRAFQSLAPGVPPTDSLSLYSERLARASSVSTELSSQVRIEKAFEGKDTATILAAIESAGGKGPAAAKALELALASTRPEYIKACLDHATDLPDVLRKLAFSRIEWLQGRKANSLLFWPDGFPDLNMLRLREDWDGWEQADFSKALEELHLCLAEELANLELPENPSPEQLQIVIDRLNDPLTLRAVGNANYASACLKLAIALTPFKEHAQDTLMFASTARNLGADPAPCLRAEALALTALGDYQKARDRWVSLITEQPVENHQPGDYAEAAYTAFENSDTRQAMAILSTGLRHYPDDANFALRAGWIALLTGNPDQAYRFLLAGNQIGYPQEKLEDATALLAIAATQNGAVDDASIFYQELIRISPAWENPETIEELDWPEEMKASLRQLTW
jgi:hypothetical protein